MDNSNRHADEYEAVRLEVASETRLAREQCGAKSKETRRKQVLATSLVCVFAALILFTPVPEMDNTLYIFTQAMTLPGESKTVVLASTETAPPARLAENIVEAEIILPAPLVRYAFVGNTIEAEELLAGAYDEGWSYAFAAPPDFNRPGWQDVTVTITGENGQQAEVASRLYLFELTEELLVEVGSPRQRFAAEDFILNNCDDVSIIVHIKGGRVDTSLIESHPVVLALGDYKGYSTVSVVASLPPAAEVRNVRTIPGKAVEATAFVRDITGHEPITVTYGKAPDFSKNGRQTVSIILEDAYQNQTEYVAELNVEQDTTAPVISGQFDKTAIQGDLVNYMAGITVKDNFDSRPALAIDSSGVNTSVAGTYSVVYTATDESGNSTSVAGTVIIISLTDTVNQMADTILAGLITRSMSERDKAQAIFNWVVNKMTYSSKTNPRDFALAAYTCFYKGAGDCYVFYAGYQTLLSRAGIESKRNERIDAPAEHYWNVVKIGGKWYHSDTCTNNTIGASERFLFTDKQAKTFSSRMRAAGREYEAYKYDASKVPEIVP